MLVERREAASLERMYSPAAMPAAEAWRPPGSRLQLQPSYPSLKDRNRDVAAIQRPDRRSAKKRSMHAAPPPSSPPSPSSSAILSYRMRHPQFFSAAAQEVSHAVAHARSPPRSPRGDIVAGRNTLPGARCLATSRGRRSANITIARPIFSASLRPRKLSTPSEPGAALFMCRPTRRRAHAAGAHAARHRAVDASATGSPELAPQQVLMTVGGAKISASASPWPAEAPSRLQLPASPAGGSLPEEAERRHVPGAYDGEPGAIRPMSLPPARARRSLLGWKTSVRHCSPRY